MNDDNLDIFIPIAPRLPAVNNHQSLHQQREIVQALPVDEISALKARFIEVAPEAVAKYYQRTGKLDAPRLPTMFIVWAYDVLTKREVSRAD